MQRALVGTLLLRRRRLASRCVSHSTQPSSNFVLFCGKTVSLSPMYHPVAANPSQRAVCPTRVPPCLHGECPYVSSVCPTGLPHFDAAGVRRSVSVFSKRRMRELRREENWCETDCCQELSLSHPPFVSEKRTTAVGDTKVPPGWVLVTFNTSSWYNKGAQIIPRRRNR